VVVALGILAILAAAYGVIVRMIVRGSQARERERERLAELRAEQDALDAERARELAAAMPKLAVQPVSRPVLRMIDDRYTVIGRLGTGERCVVHEVERLDDGQRLALKLVRVQADIALMVRFARAALGATEDLIHPNVLPLIDVGISDGQLFLVTPIVDGGPLPLLKARHGDRDWAMWILAQIAAGLAALHERGVVHRNLEAGNVLVASGVAQLTDYGLGMPGPAAPEGDVTPAADVYAFGRIACELLATTAPPALIARCLDADPLQRPKAAELAASLAPTPV
jgi:serine/threonine-protein kinase